VLAVKLALLPLVLLNLFVLVPRIFAVESTTTVSAVVPSTASNTGNVRLTGYAIPSALVTFLDSGVVAGTTTCNSAGFFDKTFTSLSLGVHTFSMYASDKNGKTTLTLSVDVNVISGSTVTLSGFLLPPTIGVGKTELKRPETQTADGYAKPSSSVTNFFNSHGTITKNPTTDSAGQWQSQVPEIFHLGSHSTNALVQDQDGAQSILSQTKAFTVVLSADLNVDNLVNLTDFSILMFSYGQSPPPNLASDINDNGPVDLVDFSVQMFYWTGG